MPVPALFRAELALSLGPGGANVFEGSCEAEEFREWPLNCSNSRDEATIVDLGLIGFGDSGDGETECRPNGLARLGEPFNCEGSIAVLVSMGHHLYRVTKVGAE